MFSSARVLCSGLDVVWSRRSRRCWPRGSGCDAAFAHIPPRIRSCSQAAAYLQRIRFGAAVQVAPIVRIPPRTHGSEAHDANETRQSGLKLAPVAYGYEPVVCAKKSINPCAFGR